jgi:thioredoxin 2
MKRDKVMLRCISCRAVNKVPVIRLKEEPKCGKCKSTLSFPTNPVKGKGITFDSEVMDWPGLVLVEFFAHWCGHCRIFNPTLEGFAREKAGIIKIVQIDVDEEPDLTQSFKVRATPTIILYENGKKLDMMSGALPREKLELWIDSVIQ